MCVDAYIGRFFFSCSMWALVLPSGKVLELLHSVIHHFYDIRQAATHLHSLYRRHGSENDDVAAFGPDQLYVVFVVADGGTDLERFDVRSAAEARSILLQARLSSTPTALL